MSEQTRLRKALISSHRFGLLVAVICSLAISASPYAFSFLGKWLVDDVLSIGSGIVSVYDQTEKIALLLRFFLFSIAIHLGGTGLAALSELINARATHEMIYKLRSMLFEKIESVDHQTYAKEPQGQLMSRIMDDSSVIPGNIIHIIINLFTQVAMLVLGAFLLIRLNPRLSLFVAVALPFYGVVCWIFLPRIKTNTEMIRTRWAGLIAYAVERIAGIVTVKNYVREDAEVDAFSERVEISLGLNRRQNRLNLLFGALSALITAFATLAVLTVGFINLRRGEMLLGEVLAFFQVTAQLFVPISALVGMTVVSQTLDVYAERVYQVLDTQSALGDTGTRRWENGDIRFQNVSLRYQENGPFALQNLTMKVKQGSSVALVGPTGCGKSTAILLLTRILDPDSGWIYIGGTNIREFPLVTHRRSIGNVLFESEIFTGTFAENVAFGSEGVSTEDIDLACRIVGLDEYADSLPDGYDTILNAGGAQLDSDELVKLNLARAIVTKPPIITVDDTYSQVPEATERQLRERLRQSMPDATIIVATSRLSIAESCDEICVLQKGTVAECGTHSQLMARPGLYRRMYTRQMGMPE